MTSDALLNGDAGPEAQANEIVRILNEEIDTAIRGLYQLAAGNSRTQVSGRMISVTEGGDA
jgi:hypothetical protein